MAAMNAHLLTRWMTSGLLVGSCCSGLLAYVDSPIRVVIGVEILAVLFSVSSGEAVMLMRYMVISSTTTSAPGDRQRLAWSHAKPEGSINTTRFTVHLLVLSAI